MTSEKAARLKTLIAIAEGRQPMEEIPSAEERFILDWLTAPDGRVFGKGTKCRVWEDWE